MCVEIEQKELAIKSNPFSPHLHSNSEGVELQWADSAVDLVLLSLSVPWFPHKMN